MVGFGALQDFSRYPNAVLTYNVPLFGSMLQIFSRYSDGVMPVYCLNSRLKCLTSVYPT